MISSQWTEFIEFDKDSVQWDFLLISITLYNIRYFWKKKPLYVRHGHSSFPVVHKGVNVGIFKIPKFENKLDVVISQINFISKDHDECKFVLTFIQLLMIPILSIKSCTKWQCCQLCVLRENSTRRCWKNYGETEEWCLSLQYFRDFQS